MSFELGIGGVSERFRMHANYAFKPTAEQALRSTQPAARRRLNAALAMTIRLLYPCDPFNPKLPDEVYAAEFQAAKALGIACSVFPLELLGQPRLRAFPPAEEGERVIYRGWMLEPTEYEKLHAVIESWGASPLTSLKNYLACHHLPNWYSLVGELTPETVVVPSDSGVEKTAIGLGWDGFFVKDFVKSLTTARGSIAKTPAEAEEIAKEIEKCRGKIEGGICLRRLERFKTGSERRYFVLEGKVFSAAGQVPELVQSVVEKVHSPFYSIDVIENDDGALRLVEVGDGQVSDIKEWSPESFARIFAGHG